MKNLFHSRKIVTAAILIPLAGIVLGVVLGWAACDYFHYHKYDDFRTHLQKKFNSRLHLTAEQQRQLAPILDKWLETYRETRQRHIDDILRNLTVQYAELRPILTAEQIELLNELHVETVQKIKNKMR
jgi:hypothetical protein